MKENFPRDTEYESEEDFIFENRLEQALISNPGGVSGTERSREAWATYGNKLVNNE